MIPPEDISALVLCGGKGRRFGYVDKPLVPFSAKLGYQPMVDYVIARLPNTAETLISANRNVEQYARRGRVIRDSDTGLSEEGPLVGIYAGLQACQTPWLLICPGDMTVLPNRWYEPLLQPSAKDSVPRVLHDGQRLQSLLCLVPRNLVTELGSYIRGGGYAVKGWHAACQASVVDSDEGPSAFINVNSEEELRAL